MVKAAGQGIREPWPALSYNKMNAILPTLDFDAIARKRDLVKAMERRQQMVKENGLLFYRPHVKQDLFHKAGKFKRRYARTGNRFGKSTMGSAEDCSWALGERIWYPKDSPERTSGIPQHATKGVIICADWDKADEIFTDEHTGKLMKLLPKSANIRTGTNQAGNVDTIKVDSIYGGTSLIKLDTVKSFLNNPMGHESSDWDWIHIDEPCPEDMYVAYVRGLVDRGGSVWFTCTPITELWINDMFFPNGKTRVELQGPLVVEAKSRWVITGSIFDNPTLTKENIDTFSEEIPDKARASRLYGKPLQLQGIVYEEFDDSVHIFADTPIGWREYNEPPPSWTIRIAIDIHEGLPQAVLFAATGPLGHTYFFAECFDTVRISAVCEQIKEILGDRRAHSIIADPRAWIESPRDGTTIADDFHANGILCEPGPKDLTRGILKTKEMLKARDRHGFPMLNFSNYLTETLREFERYVYDPKTNKPHAKAPDHMMENLYRLCVGGLEYVDPNEVIPTIKQVEIIHARMDLPKINLDFNQAPKKAMKLARYGRRG